MALINTIFKFEFRQLLRQPSLLMLLFFYIVIGTYSVYTGHSSTGRQIRGLDSLYKTQAQHLQDVHNRFHEDTSTAMGKTLAMQAGVPQVVEFRNPPYTTFPPHRLTMLAVGQRDLLPYYDLVNTKRDVLTPPNAEFINAEKLAAGNFDLSFVLIYLFPLLIIVWSHNCLSREKENQTDKLLVIQGASIHRIILYKLLFRLLVITVIAFGLSIPGFTSYYSYSRMSTADALLWLYLVFIYLLFWFSICWLVICFNKSSSWNILSALGCWLLFIIIMPAVTNSCTALIAPIPLRSALASRQRECKEETWEMQRTVLIDSFYFYHPEYRSLRKSSDTAEYGNRRFIAYADLLGRRTDRIMMVYQQDMDRYNRLLQKVLWFNAVTQLQHLLYADAESGLENYAAYEKQVTLFQQEWVTFMNSYLLYDKHLQEEDVDHLPVFRFISNTAKTKQILLQSISIWLTILIILAIGDIIHSDN